MNYDWQDTKQTFFGHTYTYIHINIHMDGPIKRLTLLRICVQGNN